MNAKTHMNLAAAAALSLLWSSPAAAAEPVSTKPLRILFAASAIPIPASSNCAGAVPGVPQPTVGALLASRFATFGDGTNRIAGLCDYSGACTVVFTHATDDDVQSSEFRFKTSAGKLIPASLQCVSSP